MAKVVNRKQYALTYAQTKLSKEEVYKFFQENFSVQEILVVQEAHEISGQHIHVYVNFSSRVFLRNLNHFNIKTEHPNIQIVGNKKGWIAYLLKTDKEYVTNMSMEELGIKSAQASLEEIFTETRLVAEQKGLEAAMLEFSTLHPELIRKNYVSFKSSLEAYLETLKKSRFFNNVKYFDLDTFCETEDQSKILDWFENRKNSKVLVLIGNSGFGKTEYLKSLLKDYNPLLFNTTESLKYFDEFRSKAIIFDDVNWSKFDEKDKIHLLDLRNQYTISIKYGSLLLPDDLIKVVTCNSKEEFIRALGYSDKTSAIIRRCEFLELKEALFNADLVDAEAEETRTNLSLKEWKKPSRIKLDGFIEKFKSIKKKLEIHKFNVYFADWKAALIVLEADRTICYKELCQFVDEPTKHPYTYRRLFNVLKDQYRDLRLKAARCVNNLFIHVTEDEEKVFSLFNLRLVC